MLTYSIELNAEKIYHPRTKEYFEEVFKSFVNGSNRSAVVMLYSVVISDLVYKLQELENLYNDKTAEKILEEIENKQTKDPKSSEWESYLIKEIVKRTNLLDTYAQSHLEHLRNQRHLSAHPVLNQENLLVKPNDETVRALIRSTLDSILIKNPIISRDVFNLILSDMAENKHSFITDNKLKKYLDSKYLKNMNENILNILFKDLWNITFSCNSDQCENNREINARVLSILYEENKSANKHFFESEKSLFKINYEKEILIILTEFISNHPELYSLLEAHEVLKLEEEISGNVKLKLRSAFLSEDMVEHFKEITKTLTNTDETVLLEYELSSDELNFLKKWASENEALQEYYTLLINLFIKSQSYYLADKNYKAYIQKNLTEFNQEHFIVLLNGINLNTQCYRRNRAKNDNTVIITYAKSHFSSTFKVEEKYPNVEYYEDE